MKENIVISFPKDDRINYLVIKKDNLTVYFKGLDELLVIMEFAEKIHDDYSNPLTYVFTHETEDDAKERYHQGIDPNYTDEQHYHFERKDRADFSRDDIERMVDLLIENELLEAADKIVILNKFENQEKKRSLSPTFSIDKPSSLHHTPSSPATFTSIGKHVGTKHKAFNEENRTKFGRKS